MGEDGVCDFEMVLDFVEEAGPSVQQPHRLVVWVLQLGVGEMRVLQVRSGGLVAEPGKPRCVDHGALSLRLPLPLLRQ